MCGAPTKSSDVSSIICHYDSEIPSNRPIKVSTTDGSEWVPLPSVTIFIVFPPSQTSSVRSFGSQCIIDVSYADDTGFYRDALTLEAGKITFSVIPFVVVEDYVDHGLRKMGQFRHICAPAGVLFYQGHLILREGAGVIEYGFRNPYFSTIVQPTPPPDVLPERVVQTQGFCYGEGIPGDPLQCPLV